MLDGAPAGCPGRRRPLCSLEHRRAARPPSAAVLVGAPPSAAVERCSLEQLCIQVVHLSGQWLVLIRAHASRWEGLGLGLGLTHLVSTMVAQIEGVKDWNAGTLQSVATTVVGWSRITQG